MSPKAPPIFSAASSKTPRPAIDDQDSKLAAFKKQYMGQLPTDADNNVRMLMSLNSQLDATTQTLGRAQQDKAYTESMLAQQTAAWKSSQSSTNPQTLEQQLTQLQGQLLQLQARYTDDYPDVIKTKADIAEVEKKLKEINAAAAANTATDSNEKASATEPPEIRQLRLQIHQYQGVIEQATVDQKRLQSSIGVYQSRTAMSPASKSNGSCSPATTITRRRLLPGPAGQEELRRPWPPTWKTSSRASRCTLWLRLACRTLPAFPTVRCLPAAAWVSASALGLLIAIWLEFSDKSIRTEKDAAAVMDLPLLISVPWLGEEGGAKPPSTGTDAAASGAGAIRAPSKDHEKVEV